jgi:hypothetical protein
MLDSPAFVASDSAPHAVYFCAACKRRHDGLPYGSVGSSLDYCEPAITHLVTTGVIVKLPDAAAGPRQYWIRREG